MTTDVWIPRLTIIGQVILLAICGALVALDHNSVITDLFIAGSGGLLSVSILQAARKKASAPTE